MDRQEFWSAAMDGELSDEEFLALMEKEGCDEVAAAWRQYRLVGDHLRHGQPQRCLCRKIMDALETQQKEKPLAAPSSSSIPVKRHLWDWVPQSFVGQTAAAAGVLGAAVLLAFGGAVYFSPATQQATKINPMAAALPEPQQAAASETAQSTLNAMGSVAHTTNNVDTDQSNSRHGLSISSVVAGALISPRERSLSVQQTIKMQPSTTNVTAVGASSSDDVAQNMSIDEMNFLHQVNASQNFVRPAFFLTDNAQQ